MTLPTFWLLTVLSGIFLVSVQRKKNERGMNSEGTIMSKKNKKRQRKNCSRPTFSVIAATATVALAGQLTPSLACAVYVLVLVLAVLLDWLNGQ